MLPKMTPEMKLSMDIWLTHKKERKEAYQATGLKMVERKALRLGEERFINAVEFSVGNNYSGLFEPPEKFAAKETGTPLRDYNAN